MSVFTVVTVLAVVVGGCASTDWAFDASASLLSRADRFGVTARTELARLRAELAARDGELARLRQETERLRADLEKLKEVDLNLERKKR